MVTITSGQGSEDEHHPPPPPPPVMMDSRPNSPSYGPPNRSVTFDHTDLSRVNPVGREIFEFMKSINFPDINSNICQKIAKRILNRIGDASFSLEAHADDIVNQYLIDTDDPRSSTPGATKSQGTGTAIVAHYPGPINLPILEIATQEAMNPSSDIYYGPSGQDLEALQRITGGPTGVENIGQTCWFSVVVQLLYSLPDYRQLLYSLTPDNEIRSTTADSLIQNGSGKLGLLVALRELFALMEAGNRVYVNPHRALEMVSGLHKNIHENSSNKDTYRQIVGHHQDAMEMLMLMIEWIDQAVETINAPNETDMAVASIANETPKQVEQVDMFALPSTSGENQSMMDGEAPKIEEKNEEDMETESTSGTTSVDQPRKDNPLKPLFYSSTVEISRTDPNDRRSVHSALLVLLADVTEGDLHHAIEKFYHSTTSTTWFENIPSVFLVQLKRYDFNATVGRANKVNSAFQFPQQIYMDRYLERNRGIVEQLLNQRAHLRHNLAGVKNKLKGYTEYTLGQDGGTARLSDILAAAEAFGSATTTEPTNPFLADIVEFNETDPVEHCSYVAQNKVLPTPNSAVDPYMIDRLRLLRQQAIMKEQALRTDEMALTRRIEELFDEPTLRQEQFYLKVVVIHEGNANSGHYWAYIRKSQNSVDWLKVNDQSVEWTTWEVVERDAFGDRPNTSAYGMAYMRVQPVTVPEEEHNELNDLNLLLNQLPEDLRKTVSFENMTFQIEIQRSKPVIRTKTDMAILDPNNLGRNLSENLTPLFVKQADRDAQIEKVDTLLSAIHQKHTERDRFDPSFTHSLRTLEVAAYHVIEGIERELYMVPMDAGRSTVAQMRKRMEELTDEQAKQIFELMVTKWYEHAAEAQHLSVLNYWLVTNIGMPAKLHRYIIAKMVRQAKLGLISDLGRKESGEFEQNTDSCDYVLAYKRIMGIYEITRHICSVLRTCAEMYEDTDMIDVNRINEIVAHWEKALRGGLEAQRFYFMASTEVCDISMQQKDVYHLANVDLDRLIVPEYIIRGAVLVPLVKMYWLLVFCLMSKDVTRSTCLSLFEPQMDRLCYVTHFVCKWGAQAPGISRVVSDRIAAILRRLRGNLDIDDALYTNIIDRLGHSMAPTAEVPAILHTTWVDHSVSLSEEYAKMRQRQQMVGFDDDADMENTVNRLLNEMDNMYEILN